MGAEAVLVGTVSRVENKTVKTEDGEEAITGQTAYVQVEESFKGVKASEMIFRSYGSSCDPQYKEGQRWLFYARFNKDDKAWQIGYCDRSTLIESAPDDLLYLRNLPASAQKTRIAGVLRSGHHNPLMGIKVKVTDGRQTYEAFTDKNGVYELFGLPPGKYSIEAEVPPTLKIRFLIPYGELDLTRRRDVGRVVLNEKSCAGVSFYFSENTSISGKVFGADGRPLKDVCLRMRSKNNPDANEYLANCSKADGSFKIDEIPLGDYLLIANEENKITSSEPFPTVYYPGVFEKEKATVVTLARGDQQQDIDIHIPSQRPTRNIEGKLLYSDGRPAVNESVEFKEEPQGSKDGETIYARTDAEGRFSLQLLEGMKGSLRAYILTYRGQNPNCPQREKLIKTQDQTSAELQTNVIKLEMNTDQRDLELKFPFPYCVTAQSPQ